MQNSIPNQRDSGAVSVGTGLTILDTLVMGGYSDAVAVDVANAGPAALVDFQVLIQMHPNAAFEKVFVAADYVGSPPPAVGAMMPLLGANDPATLASGTSSFMKLDKLKGVHALQFQAQSASTSQVTLRTSRLQDT